MPLNNYVEELEYTGCKGMDTTSPRTQIPDGYVYDAWNTDCERNGGYSKRQGYQEQLGSAWTGMSIRSGIEYKISTTTAKLVLFGTDEVSSGILADFSTGSPVNIQTGISPTKRVELIQFDNTLYAFNGDSANMPLSWDGATVRSLGISPSTGKPTGVAGASAGNLVQSANYRIAYTFYNSVTGAESSPSQVSDAVQPNANKSIDWALNKSYTPASSQANQIKIYRTVADGLELFYETSIPIASTTHTSIASDASLTYPIEWDNTTLATWSNAPKYAAVVRNRIFVVTGDNEIHNSKIGRAGPMPESFEAKGVITTTDGLGNRNKIVGVNEINGIPIVLKNFSIGRLEEQGIPDLTSSYDNVVYFYRELAGGLSAVSHFAAIRVMNELVFLGLTNVYATDGTQVRPIGDAIQNTIKNLDFRAAKFDFISCGNDLIKNQVYFSVYSSITSQQPDYILVGNYEQYPEFRWTVYCAGTNSVTHPGMRVGCFFSQTNIVNGVTELYFGNTDLNGQYYKLNDGDNDNGLGIHWKLVTRPYMIKAPMITKLFANARAYIQAFDATYQLSIGALYDLGSTIVQKQTYTIIGNGGKWDINTWAGNSGSNPTWLIWSGANLAEVTYPMHVRAKMAQIVFEQTEADAPITLLSWGVNGNLQGPGTK